jgi:LysR family nitrogen assimilation transcriptional regulator
MARQAVMEIGQLRAFLAVVETSSVTRAAELVGLTPGAVSQQLRALATELGTELLVRTGKRIAPSPEAHRLAEHARSILQLVDRIKQECENDPLGDTRPFHFATGATALIYRLGTPLRTLRKRFPQTEIHVTVAATEEIAAGLLSRRFDLGLLTMPVHEEKLTILPLFEEELLGLRPAPARSSRAKAIRLQPAELAAAPFLLYPRRSNMRYIIDAFFQSIGISPRVTMEADDTEAIKRLVAAGFGYSILPEYSLRGQSRFFEIFRVAGHKLVRRQALAMVKTEYPRQLTVSIARVIQSALT